EDCFNFPVSTNSLSRVMLNYDKGEVKNVHYGDVLIKYPCILNIKKEEIPYITGGCLEAYNSNLLENGDLIFADAAEDETVGKAVEVNGITNENLVSGLHTIVARATTQKATYFLGYYINSDIYHRQLLRLMQGSKVSAISKGNLQKTDLSFPKDIEEQQKIGSYFKKLDDTIALHQRKLDALKQMKKGFLQQMFPKSEEDVPKIRFTDFNGNWRQRKLEEVADRVRGNDRRMELPTLTISASKGWLNQHERFFGNIAGKEQKNYTLLKKGQLSYNHGNSKSAKYGAVFVLRTYDEALVPRIYHSFKMNILANSDFIEYLFATKIPDRELRKIISSGARMDGLLNINFNDFMSILIMLPFVEEQIKISNFLIRLDKIISLYQNKLDQLIKLKKAYLQYLFI
ncbi:restriction endonuclease subunit S, partial [Listeria monocytogenes]|nr:restriction endonuclease subunit S [Listeria monocytogenes]